MPVVIRLRHRKYSLVILLCTLRHIIIWQPSTSENELYLGLENDLDDDLKVDNLRDCYVVKPH